MKMSYLVMSCSFFYFTLFYEIIKYCKCSRMFSLRTTQWQHLSPDSPRDAGPARMVSLWDQQLHWEVVDQWDWRCDRYGEHLALCIFTLLMLMSFNTPEWLFAVLLNKSPKDICPDFRGNGMLWRYCGLDSCMQRTEKLKLKNSFIFTKMLVLTSFNIFFSVQFSHLLEFLKPFLTWDFTSRYRKKESFKCVLIYTFRSMILRCGLIRDLALSY